MSTSARASNLLHCPSHAVTAQNQVNLKKFQGQKGWMVGMWYQTSIASAPLVAKHLSLRSLELIWQGPNSLQQASPQQQANPHSFLLLLQRWLSVKDSILSIFNYNHLQHNLAATSVAIGRAPYFRKFTYCTRLSSLLHRNMQAVQAWSMENLAQIEKPSHDLAPCRPQN